MKKQLPLTVAILSVAFFQMSMVALAPIVSAITHTFPGVSALAVQLATTFLNLVLVITAVFAGPISARLGRRTMTVVGMVLYVLVGIMGRFCSVGLWAVYLWSGLLGLGTGLFVPAISSLMLICYSPEEQQAVSGVESAAVNFGGMVLSILSGALAAGFWSNAYLCFVFAVIPMVLSLLFMPDRSREKNLQPPSAEKGDVPKGLPKEVWLGALQTFIFGILYFTFSTNISFLLGEKGYDATSLAGLVTGAFMLGGVVCGLLFKWFAGVFRRFTPTAAYLLLAISYFALTFSHNTAAILLCSFVGGGSLSFIFPYLLITAGGTASAEANVAASSMIVCVAPNFGSFLSPVILTNLTNIFSNWADSRFLLAAVLAFVGAGVLALCQLRKSGKSHPPKRMYS